MGATSTAKVFISYSHSDREWARQYVEAMIGRGLNVWFDVLNIKAGQPWSAAWEKALRQSDVIVLLVNSDNINRPNLFFELGAALGMKKRIIPVVPQGFEVNQLPPPLRDIEFVIRTSPEETAKELEMAVETLHGEAA